MVGLMDIEIMFTVVDKQLVEMLSYGKRQTEIAEDWGVSVSKINYRMQILLDEMKCKNAAHLVATAMREGLIG
jgi:DNA-binding CsgD family transcriptional regulator